MYAGSAGVNEEMVIKNKNYQLIKGIIFIVIGTILVISAFFVPNSEPELYQCSITSFKILSPQSLSIALIVIGMVLMMVGMIMIRMEYMRRDGLL